MRSRVVATLIVAVLSIGLFGGVVGAGPQPLTFSLDWRPQAPHAPFLLALQRGYFESEGVSVTIERGYGSADAIEQVATGVYDMGFGDFNTIIEHNVKKPDHPVIAVAIVTPPSFLEANGDSVRAVLRAVIRGWQAALAAFALERVPGIAEVYTAELLPPLDDRRPPQ